MIENKDNVNVYSFIRPKRTKDEVDWPNPMTQHNLDRVMKELREKKKTMRDQSIDDEQDNNPLATKIQAKIVYQFWRSQKINMKEWPTLKTI